MTETIESFANSLSTGEVVGVANVINDLDRYRTVEDCARAVIPEVVRLLEDCGYKVRPPKATA